MARVFDLTLSDLLTLNAIPDDDRALKYAQKDIEEDSAFIATASPQIFNNLRKIKGKMLTNVQPDEKPTKPVDSKEEFAQFVEERCVSY